MRKAERLEADEGDAPDGLARRTLAAAEHTYLFDPVVEAEAADKNNVRNP